MLGEFVISSVLSCHNKNLKQRTSVTALRWTSVTALCYSSVLFRKQRKIHPQGIRARQPKRREEKRGPQPKVGSSCNMFFLLPLGLPYVNWASQECCLFYLRFPTPVLGPSFVLFLRAQLPCLLATAILDSFFLF